MPNLNGAMSAADQLIGTLSAVGSLSGSIRGIQLFDGGITAESGDVKQGKKFVSKSGTLTDGSYLWNWMGDKVEYMGQIYNTSYALSATTFGSWTPSTTSKSIKASTTLSSKAFVADMTQYEYVIRWKCRFVAVHQSGATLANQVYKEVADMYQMVFRRPNTNATVVSGTFDYNVCASLYNAPITMYYNSNGTIVPYYSITYGIYPSATTAGISNTTSNTPTITPKTPAYNARCSSTYFATARASELDQTNSMIYIVGELYRVPIGSTMGAIYKDLVSLYNT